VRERCAIGDGVVIGRGVCVENDTAIGAGTKIQTNAYITAYCTLEDHVFIGHSVMFINDSYPRATRPGGASRSRAGWSWSASPRAGSRRCRPGTCW